MSEVKIESRFLKEQGQEGVITDLIEPVIEDLGYRVVRVKLSDHQGNTLQIMAEKTDGTLDINDCKKITKAISPLLDLSDVVKNSYSLEVSSPGIDRPLVRLSDIEKYHGCEVKIELKKPIDGRKRFRGILDGFEKVEKTAADENNNVEIRLAVKLKGFDDEQVIGINTSSIADVKLILSKYIFKSVAKKEEQVEKPKKKSKKRDHKRRNKGKKL